MKLRTERNRKVPELNIIPMIDIMFFLLVFFMLSMIDLKTIPVKLPQAANASADTTTTFAVTLKSNGSIYLGDKETDMQSLLMQAALEQKNNSNFAIVIRAEKDIEYGSVIELVDKLKGTGITRFGLATDGVAK